MNFKWIYSLAVCVALSLMVGCKKQDSPVLKNTAVVFDSITDKYYEQYLKMFPLEATLQGDDRYNNALPVDIDKEFIKGEIDFYRRIQEDLEKVDYESLSEEDKVVYNVLDTLLKDKVERYAYNPEYIPFTQFSGLPLDFPMLGSGQGAQPFKTEKDYENWLLRMQKFEAWMDKAKENFDLGIKNNHVLPKILVQRMIPQLRAEEITSKNFDKNIFYGPLRNFPKGFSAETKKKFTDSYITTIETKIIPSYLKMAQYLETQYLPKARATDGYNALPKGNEIYKYYVKSWTTTNKSVDEIHQLGVSEVARIRSEMEKVKNTLGFEGSLNEFLLHVKNDPKAMPYKTEKEVINAFNSVLDKISPKLKTMFKQTPKTPFEIRQTEKYREASASAEYRQGTPDGSRPGIFYIPIPDPARFNVSSGMESLFLHEAIPGHHYQISLQQENEALPKFMRFGWLGAYGEGWALYTESLGPELGLYSDPYQKLGALSDEMLRAVRLVIDTGLHTGKMNRQQAITYFLENVAYDELGAQAEVERYMAMPGQALSYKIGALKIRELRTKYEEELKGEFDLATFHDQVLNQGCLPLSILERKLERYYAKEQ